MVSALLRIVFWDVFPCQTSVFYVDKFVDSLIVVLDFELVEKDLVLEAASTFLACAGGEFAVINTLSPERLRSQIRLRRVCEYELPLFERRVVRFLHIRGLLILLLQTKLLLEVDSINNLNEVILLLHVVEQIMIFKVLGLLRHVLCLVEHLEKVFLYGVFDC